jgi:AAA+ superfamily predicted ATPase
MAENKSAELVVAVRDSDKKEIGKLLSGGGNPNCRTDGGRTMLELALLNNDIETFKRLVDSGANIMARGRDGYTMLYTSMLYNNMEAAMYLIKKGAQFSSKQDVGTGILIRAIRQKDQELIRMLVGAGVDVNSRAEHILPIIAAVESGDAEVVKLLLDNGAETEDDALMCALKRKDYAIARLLLDGGANPNCGEEYNNPLSMAAKQNSVEMFRLLLEKGALIDAHEPFEDGFRHLKSHCGPAVVAYLEDEYLKKYRPNSRKVRFDPVKITGTKFEDVVGMEKVKSELRRDILYHLKHADLAKEYKLSLGGGIMLFGPPGCGKTFITKAIAGEAGVNFIEAKVSEIFDMWVGSEGRAVKQLFAKARKSAPCILFFDEMEMLGQNRESTGHHVWAREALNVFLTEMDGATSNNEGVLVIGATNAPWMVDSALKRNGRLGKFIYVPPPDLAMREGLFRMYLNGRPLDETIDYARLALQTGECNAADIPAICNEAAKLAWEDSIVSGTKRKVGMADMERSLKKETYNMKEWFENVKQHMATEANKSLYSELNDSLKKMEPAIQGASYR